jgi:hypothetical protein
MDYLLKWRGYPEYQFANIFMVNFVKFSSENSWTPKTECNCSDLIDAYEKTVREQTSSSEKSASVDTTTKVHIELDDNVLLVCPYATKFVLYQN